MTTMKLLAIFLLSVAVAVAQNPVFPQQYYVKGVFSIPYFNITEPIEMWYDAVNNRQVINYYNGLGVYITIGETAYAITPQVDTMVCQQSEGDNGPLVSLFPDLTGWVNKGPAVTSGLKTNDYQLVMTNYTMTAQYDMFITSTGVPVQLYLNGVDFIFDSHPDIYVMDYGLYLPGYVDDSVFNVPSLCQNASVVPRETLQAGAAAKIFAGLANHGKAQDSAEAEFRAFLTKHNKKYATPEEYLKRLAIFRKTLKFINEHNSNPHKTHTVAVNHFADLTDEEFRTLIIPKVKRPVDNQAPLVHIPSGRDLPTTVDWRLKGAVTPVKDQGVCGSCYAFGSTGSLEGAYQLKYGKLISISEQQVVDCSWVLYTHMGVAFGVSVEWSLRRGGDQGNQGCNGGFAAAVYQWMMSNGGVATEASYPYLMQNGWCKASDKSSGVVVKSYVNVTSGEDSLKDAVANGPVAVAIDASHPPFRYYQSGVYYQSDCGNTIDDLDHEVLAVGYGTSNGQDYWLVKNSWSTHWGDNGYVMMSRNRDNNCGIATQANYPIV